ncbi:hypothetical protein [Nocardioides panacis]|nr:hypothetical protein [Nocardioides panacis]
MASEGVSRANVAEQTTLDLEAQQYLDAAARRRRGRARSLSGW